MLMCGITFVATRNYYSAQSLPIDTCIDNTITLSAISNSVAQPSQNTPEIIVSASQQLTADKTSLSQQKNQNIDELVKAREQQQQHIDSFRKFAAAEHKQPLIEEANHRYEAEVVDYQWAAAQEDKLLSVFTESPSLSSYAPTQMSCRSSTCKFIIPSQDDTTADEAYQAVRQTLADQVNSITYFRNPDKGEVVMYISAQGNSIFK